MRACIVTQAGRHKDWQISALYLPRYGQSIESAPTYLAAIPKRIEGSRPRRFLQSLALCFAVLYFPKSFVPRGREGAGRNHRLAAEGRMRRSENSAYSGLLRAIRKLCTGLWQDEKKRKEKIQMGLTRMSRHRKQGYPNQCGWSGFGQSVSCSQSSGQSNALPTYGR